MQVKKNKEEFMFEAFSTNAIKMIDEALKIANSLGKKVVGSEHLLLSMYQSKDSICHFLLEEKNIQYEDILNIIENLVILRKVDDNEVTYTKKFQEIIMFSETLALDLESEYVYDEHIFYVMLKENDSVACVVLEKLGLDLEELIIDIEEIFHFLDDKNERIPYPFLINLTTSKKVHPFVSRNNYIDKIKLILSKKQKNNPLLIGNAGVGKTAIVEGLAENIAEDIYQLDLGSIVSGTKYRGELEEKLTKAMEYVKKKKAILFIDEIHNIVGAGSNDGSLDIANILKPYLSRSDIKLIGATTLDEYYRYIDKDKALSRRFQNIFIDEPTEFETYHILNEIKKSYEEYHHMKYSNKIIKYIIEKSKLYLVSKNFPDKAIDVMDETGARKKLCKKNMEAIVDEVIEDMTGIKNLDLVTLKKSDLNYPILKKKYLQFIKKDDLNYQPTNIAVVRVNDDFEISFLMDDLYQLFSFKKEMYLEVDLENYQDYTMMNNLIGSSKGYVGYEQGGILSEHIIRYPISLIYLRNFDKAHFSIQHFFSQLFKKSSFVDNKGRKIYLTNTVFVINKKEELHKQTGFFSHAPSNITNPSIFLPTLKKQNQQKEILSLLNKYHIQIVNFSSVNEKNYLDLMCLALLEDPGIYVYEEHTHQLRRTQSE